ncbi:hypothetical protein [Sphingomonas sp. R86521]|uniref:hypothetical protein n=1 Tax=Sphingomonas sp. R86521 TaxID=3093860 RepID=UPI0036D3DA79
MIDVGETFAVIAAYLEEMHGVAVEGQSPMLTADEGWVLLASLRDGVQRVSRTMADIALTLG